MKIAGVILGIIGIMFLCMGGLFILVKYSKGVSLQNDEQATAVVTGIEHSHYYSQEDDREVDSYCAEFTFKTKEGQTISFKQGSIDNACTIDSNDYQVGEQVPVYYDPSNPANTAALTKGEDRFESVLAIMAIIFIPLAILFIVLGVGLFVMGLVKSRRGATASTSY